MKLVQHLHQLFGRLTWPAQRRLATLIYPEGTQPADFLEPAGEPALMSGDSVSWRVFRNPVAMFVGGVTAVLLELGEPRVRSGVWEHTTFRQRPLQRLQRTGYAAMMTAFGARSRAEALIRRINEGHGRVSGRTPAGTPYRATDVDLLTWVHATATFGFLQAYATCVRDVDAAERDRFYAENVASAHLYGVQSPPNSQRDFDVLLQRMQPELEPSGIVLEFLAIMAGVELLPVPLRGLQRLLIRAAVHNLPGSVRQQLGLAGARWDVPPWQWTLLRALGRAADHLDWPNLPAMLVKQRLAAASAR
jgi:uncharacterized protein (DUF2236 family)